MATTKPNTCKRKRKKRKEGELRSFWKKPRLRLREVSAGAEAGALALLVVAPVRVVGLLGAPIKVAGDGDGDGFCIVREREMSNSDGFESMKGAGAPVFERNKTDFMISVLLRVPIYRLHNYKI